MTEYLAAAAVVSPALVVGIHSGRLEEKLREVVVHELELYAELFEATTKLIKGLRDWAEGWPW